MMVELARDAFPDECCGILAGRDGRVEGLFRGTNAEPTPFTFLLDPEDQLRIFNGIMALGWEMIAVFHSHARSPAYPSRRDVTMACYPDAVHVIVSLPERSAPPGDAVVRAFWIRDGAIREEELTTL